MKRSDKYPDTSTFHFHNANPHNRITDDCVVRALSTATGVSWETVYKELFEIGLHYGYITTDRKCYDKWLSQRGWIKHPQLKKPDGTKYTGREFCSIISGGGTYIAHIGGHHIVCIKDSKVWDIFDSTDGCVGNYWTKELA